MAWTDLNLLSLPPSKGIAGLTRSSAAWATLNAEPREEVVPPGNWQFFPVFSRLRMVGNSFQSCGSLGEDQAIQARVVQPWLGDAFTNMKFFLPLLSFRFHDPISPAYFGRCLNQPTQVELFKFRYICFIRVLTTADLANIFGRCPSFVPLWEKNRSFSAKVVSWDRCVSKTLGICHISPVAETSQVMAEAIPPQQNHCSLAFAFPFGHLSGFQFFDSKERN